MVQAECGFGPRQNPQSPALPSLLEPLDRFFQFFNSFSIVFPRGCRVPGPGASDGVLNLLSSEWVVLNDSLGGRSDVVFEPFVLPFFQTVSP